jgi:hypothetical protein
VQGIAGGVGIDDHGEPHGDFVDRLGHGTAVTAVLREKAPDAALFAIKVFDRELRATGTALAAAMRWARLADVHFINLSLGTTNADHEPALADEVRRAVGAGVVVIAAAPDARHRWLPGALPGVIRVTADMEIPRDTCRATRDEAGGIVIIASGYPRPIPGVPPERNLKGSSFAVANATGLLARAWPAWESALFPR